MLDTFDQKLVLELSRDGRRSYVDLARSLDVTETTIRKRVKNLLDAKVISITATPDLEVLGYDFTAIVGLQIHPADVKTVAEHLVGHPNVCYVANVTGQFDFIIIVVTRSAKEFSTFIADCIAAIPGIIRTETSVVLNNYKGKPTGLDTSHLISGLQTRATRKTLDATAGGC